MSRKRGKARLGCDQTGRYWQSASYNERVFLMLRDDIINLALSRFKWVNLPETCDPRYLEWCLLFDGCATIAHPSGSDDLWLSLQAVQYDTPNMYGEPKAWRAQGDTGRTRFMVTPKNGVYIYDNLTRYPTIAKINIWARELADIIRVKQMNRFHQRIPLIITGAAEKTFDMTNLLKQIAGGELAIITTNGIDNIDVRAQPTQIPFIGSDLQAEYENTWNNVYRMLGIDSLPFKKERRIEDEVNSDKEPSELAALSPLECRRKAARKLNERFGLNISVVWHEDNASQNYNNLANIRSYYGMIGGADNGDTTGA